MSTFFWLPSDTTADVSVTPSATDWDGHINAVYRKMNLVNLNSFTTTLAYNPDPYVDHLTDVASMIAQFVSDILPPQTIPAQVITVGVRTLESNALNNLYEAWKLYAVSVDGTSVLGTLVPWFKSAISEMPTAISGYCEGRTSSAFTSDVPFRLVLEVGADGLPVTGGGRHNFSWSFGETFAVGGQFFPQNDDTTGVPSLLVFKTTLLTDFNPKTGARIGI